MAAENVQECFSTEELARLNDGLPDLARWSPSILVPFCAYRLRNACVAWLNERWFNERQFDLSDDKVRTKAARWILDQFTYIASTSNAEVDTTNSKTLYADRYGSSTGMACHGGSGRVAVTGNFQAKGIGQTPLVSAGSSPGHSHGNMSLAEAIREAIFAEIAAAEFPHEVIPIIAIIDTGLTFSSPDASEIYDQKVRRAIAIRPAVVRIAHAERAPLFKVSATGFNNAQAEDAQRTKEVINHWMGSTTARIDDRHEIQVLTSTFRSIVEQIAFGQVHRLFCGGFFSSNITIDGGFLDFGNTHALPNWSRAQVHSSVEGFGSEMRLLDHIVGSMSFHVAKYRSIGNGASLNHNFHDDLSEHYAKTWGSFASSLFQTRHMCVAAQQEILSSLVEYYDAQQCLRNKYQLGKVISGSGQSEWLYNGIIDGRCVDPHTPEAVVLKRIDRCLRRHVTNDIRRGAWRTASRLLSPRMMLDRHKLLTELAALTAVDKKCTAEMIDTYIVDKIDSSRRFWPQLPDGITVTAHVVRRGSAALQTEAGNPCHVKLWIEGPIGLSNSMRFFGQNISVSDAQYLGLQRRGHYWVGFVDATACAQNHRIKLQEREVFVPPMAMVFQPPDQVWLS